MQKRIYCPNPKHPEDTPSCVIYDTHAFCFGCGSRFALEELGLSVKQGETYERPTTNIAADIARINALPKGAYRGLCLHYDSDYSYLVWPGNDYYIARSRSTDSGRKYLCPAGHRRPLFVARQERQNTLAIIEGELNAASLALVSAPFDVCSPGAAGNFNLEKYANFFLKYTRFVLISDKDRAGFNAAVSLKTQLLKHTPYVTILLMEQDFNDILQAEGTAGIERWLVTNGIAHTDVVR
jgi:hypothetical protein